MKETNMIGWPWNQKCLMHKANILFGHPTECFYWKSFEEKMCRTKWKIMMNFSWKPTATVQLHIDIFDNLLSYHFYINFLWEIFFVFIISKCDYLYRMREKSRDRENYHFIDWIYKRIKKREREMYWNFYWIFHSARVSKCIWLNSTD